MGTPSLDKVPNLIKFSQQDARFFQTTVCDLLGRNDFKFPGAQPVSFARRHLKELERVDYFLAEKTDGIRLLLYLTRLQDPNGQWIEAQFLIDRKNDYYYIQSGYLHLPCTSTPDGRPGPDGKSYDVNSYHVNTLLDGELVLQRFPGRNPQLTYIIFDILLLRGQNVTDRTYAHRIDKILRDVTNPYKAFIQDWPEDNRNQPFQIKAKTPKQSYAAPVLFQELPLLPHGNDGLIFTCKDTPYVSGTDQHILKWKPPHENTVDFKLQIGAFPMAEDENGRYEDFDRIPEIELLVFHGNRDDYRYFAHLHLTETEWEAMKAKNEQFDHRIIECWREKETGNWRPKIDEDGTPRFRDDKEHANHYTVVESVLQSIEDAVTKEDIVAAYEPIRNAWKAREARAKEAAMRQQQQPPSAHAPSLSRRTSSQPDNDGPRYVD